MTSEEMTQLGEGLPKAVVEAVLAMAERYKKERGMTRRIEVNGEMKTPDQLWLEQLRIKLRKGCNCVVHCPVPEPKRAWFATQDKLLQATARLALGYEQEAPDEEYEQLCAAYQDASASEADASERYLQFVVTWREEPF